MCALNKVTEYLLAGFLSLGRHTTDSIAACMEIKTHLDAFLCNLFQVFLLEQQD